MNDYEQNFMVMTERIMTDKTTTGKALTIADCWTLLMVLQLACRHPAISDSLKMQFRYLGDGLGAEIIIRHPDARDLLAMGWNERYDVDQH